MKYRLTLDESAKDYDKIIEASGLTFVVDPFAASFLEKLIIDWDDYDENFVVINEDGSNSSC
jgi:Fe-S cluster assembly iron-binding protein IscA